MIYTVSGFGFLGSSVDRLSASKILGSRFFNPPCNNLKLSDNALICASVSRSRLRSSSTVIALLSVAHNVRQPTMTLRSDEDLGVFIDDELLQGLRDGDPMSTDECGRSYDLSGQTLIINVGRLSQGVLQLQVGV